MHELFSKKGISSRYRWHSFMLLTIAICGTLMYLRYSFRHFIPKNSNDNQDKANNIPKTLALSSEDGKCSEACSTDSCIRMSDMLLRNMDEKIDPCDDFYTFACGNFERYQTENDLFGMPVVHFALLQKMMDVLQNIDSGGKSAPGKLKIVFDSCMDERSSELTAIPILMEYLTKFGLKFWPHLPQDFSFTRPSIYESIAIMQSYKEKLNNYLQGSGFFQADVTDFSQPNPRILEITSGFISDEPLVKEYEELAMKVLKYMGVAGTEAKSIFDDYKGVYDTYRDLLVSAADAVEDSMTEHAIDCTTDDPKRKNIEPLCKLLKHYVEYNKMGGKVSKTKVKVKHVTYFQALFPQIERFSERSFANYLALSFVLELRDYINAYIRGSRPLVDEASAGKMDYDYESRRKFCTNWAKVFMRGVFYSEYAKQKLSDEDLHEIRQIVNTYASASAYVIWNQPWIEENRRKKFADEVQRINHNMDEKLDLLLRSNLIQKWYSDYEPTHESFLKNSLELMRHGQIRVLLRDADDEILREFVNTFDYLDVNAFHYYDIEARRSKGMEIMFGFVLPPNYEHGRPKLVNLITIGEFMAHEMGHLIQRFFELNETLDDQTIINYHNKKKCLLEQYSNFEIKQIGQKVDSVKTFMENEADIIAVNVFEKFLDLYLEREGEDAGFSLPSLNYTNEQILYIAKEQYYCGKPTLDEVWRGHLTDEHTLNEIRVLAKTLNSRKFSQIFNCKEGDRMHLHEKCKFFE